jgi:hypothetical protein
MHAPRDNHAQRGILGSSKPAVFQLLFLLISIVLFSTLLRAQQSGVRIKEKIEINPKSLTERQQASSIVPGIELLADSYVHSALQAGMCYYFEINGVCFGSMTPVERFSQLLARRFDPDYYDFGRFSAETVIRPRINVFTSYTVGYPDPNLIQEPRQTADIYFDYNTVTGQYEPIFKINVSVKSLFDHMVGRFSKDSIESDGESVLSLEPLSADSGAVGLHRNLEIAVYTTAPIEFSEYERTDGFTYIYKWEKARQAIKALGIGAYGDGTYQQHQVEISCSLIRKTTRVPIWIKTVRMPCFYIEPVKKRLTLRDTTLLYVRRDDTVEITNDNMFYIQIIGTETDKGLLQWGNGEPNTVLSAVTSPVKYIAPDTIDADSIVVSFYVAESGGGIITSLKDSIKSEEERQQIKNRLLIRALSEGGCTLGEVTVKKDSLDHFEVNVIPDTISTKDTVAYTEGAKLEIKAQDKENKEIELNESTKLKLALITNSEYGTFINANNDTLHTTPVILNDILYSDAKDGKIKFAAIKKNPDTLVTCKVRVELQNDTTKKGDTAIIVVEQTLKIVMDTPLEVRPSIPTENGDRALIALRRKPFEVKMTRGGRPVANHPFKLTTDYVRQSGGHIHGDTQDTIRQDNNDNYGCFLFGQPTRQRRPLDTLTNAQGRFALSYNASIYGDTMKIYLKSRNKPLLLDSISVVEKVSGLINFIDVAQNCTFAQSAEGTIRHPENNWCTPEMRDSLQLAIDDFYDWSLTREGGGRPIRLSINDMSLKLGGRFDIDARWDRDTTGAIIHNRHYYHRTGKSVDINNVPVFKIPDPRDPRNRMLTPLGRKLREFMNRHQGRIYPEPQIHFDFH